MKAVVGLAIGVFVLSVVGTLALRFYLAPAAHDLPEAGSVAAKAEPADAAELRQRRVALRADIDRLESEIDRTRAQHSLAQARARTLIDELERHETRRDRLLSGYRARKETIEMRLAELDRAIADQVAERDRRDARLTEAEALYQMDSMLAYAHPLNDSTMLNQALRESPKRHLEWVRDRFERIMQPPDYAWMAQAHERLEPILAELNERHGHGAQVVTLFCGAAECEVQLAMATPRPFYDYWRETVDRVAAEADLGSVEVDWATQTEAGLAGMVVLRRYSR